HGLIHASSFASRSQKRTGLRRASWYRAIERTRADFVNAFGGGNFRPSCRRASIGSSLRTALAMARPRVDWIGSASLGTDSKLQRPRVKERKNAELLRRLDLHDAAAKIHGSRSCVGLSPTMGASVSGHASNVSADAHPTSSYSRTRTPSLRASVSMRRATARGAVRR